MADNRLNLAHAVSADFKMSAGIAVKFKEQFGSEENLRNLNMKPGGIAILEVDGRLIFYLVTKPRYYQKPNPLDIMKSLISLRDFCLQRGITQLNMPRIAAGCDGRSWRGTIKPMLTRIFHGTGIFITVYVVPNTVDPEWNKDHLKKIAVEMVRRNFNRGYRQRILKRYGSFQNYRREVYMQSFVPSDLEVRAWAEYFFLQIPIEVEGTTRMVGCWQAPRTRKITLRKVREEREPKRQRIRLRHQ